MMSVPPLIRSFFPLLDMLRNIQHKGKERETAKRLVSRSNVRCTRRRCAVLEILLRSDDHPTAALIYERCRATMSLATVYNCLDALTQAGLVNRIFMDTGPARYCPNLYPHVHFVDETTQQVIDVHLRPGVKAEDVFDLPAGAKVRALDACLRGSLPFGYSEKKES